jgi:anti-sigma factor RsiW
MAEKMHEERLEQLMAYYGGDLEGEELAEMEAHLASCEDCRRTLRQARQVLPVAEAMLAFKPKRTIDEQVARFEAMWAERDRATRKQAGRPVLLWVGLAVGAAAAILLALALIRQAPPNPNTQVYAPDRVKDAG